MHVHLPIMGISVSDPRMVSICSSWVCKVITYNPRPMNPFGIKLGSRIRIPDRVSSFMLTQFWGYAFVDSRWLPFEVLKVIVVAPSTHFGFKPTIQAWVLFIELVYSYLPNFWGVTSLNRWKLTFQIHGFARSSLSPHEPIWVKP